MGKRRQSRRTPKLRAHPRILNAIGRQRPEHRSKGLLMDAQVAPRSPYRTVDHATFPYTQLQTTIKGEWYVENIGVAPEIEVEYTPSEVIKEHDPQLERAVHDALKLLEENRARRPPPIDRVTKEQNKREGTKN